jgi:hypothetical protein
MTRPMGMAPGPYARRFWPLRHGYLHCEVGLMAGALPAASRTKRGEAVRLS